MAEAVSVIVLAQLLFATLAGWPAHAARPVLECPVSLGDAPPSPALERFDIFGGDRPTEDEIVNLLAREAVGTGLDARARDAATAWFDYIYANTLGRPAPDLGLLHYDALLIFPQARRRIRNAWLILLEDLRRLPAPEIKMRPGFPVMTTREVPPWTGRAAEPETLKTVLSLGNDLRPVILFLSGYFGKYVKLGEATALDRYLDLAWARFAPGEPRRGFDYAKRAAKDIANGTESRELRLEWIALREAVQRRMEASAQRPAAPVPMSPPARDILDGRPFLQTLDRVDSRITDARAIVQFIQFLKPFVTHGRITGEDGVFRCAQTALWELRPALSRDAVVAEELYRMALRHLRGIGLIKTAYAGLMKRLNEGRLEKDDDLLLAFGQVVRLIQWQINAPDLLAKPLTLDTIRATIERYDRVMKIKG